MYLLCDCILNSLFICNNFQVLYQTHQTRYDDDILKMSILECCDVGTKVPKLRQVAANFLEFEKKRKISLAVMRVCMWNMRYNFFD